MKKMPIEDAVWMLALAVTCLAACSLGEHSKEHYILDIDHRKEAVNVIATLLPHLPYPKPKKKL